MVQSSFFVSVCWSAALSCVKAPSVSLLGSVAVLGFGGAARFASAARAVAFLRTAGLAVVVRSLGGGLSVFVAPSLAAVAARFPWAVSRG